MIRSLILFAALALASCGDSDKPRPTPRPVMDWSYTDGGTHWIATSSTLVIGERGAHYVTKEASLRGKTSIRLRFRLDAPIVTKTEPYGPGLVTLFFQRKYDDWRVETYRWWLTSGTIVTTGAGEYEVTGTIDDRWTAVQTSNSIDRREAFLDAWNHTARVGFTLGGGTGYGHGVYGPATLTILSFEIN